MMSLIITALVLISVVLGGINGKIDAVSSAALGGCIEAVRLAVTLLGGMCLWSGVMNVAEKAGLTKALGRLLAPAVKRLFKGINPNGKAAAAITMNIAANILGLGNAATPFGIMAMTEMKAESGAQTATRAMIMFVVINTASVTLIPTTVATLRLENGAAQPLDILPAVWLSSAVSLIAGVAMVALLARFFERKGKSI